MDDLEITKEGEYINPKSIFKVPLRDDLPDFPNVSSKEFKDIIKLLITCPMKWAIFLNQNDYPILVVNTNNYLKSYYSGLLKDPYKHCHTPIIFENINVKLADVIYRFKVESKSVEEDVIDHDVILL